MKESKKDSKSEWRWHLICLVLVSIALVLDGCRLLVPAKPEVVGAITPSPR